MNRPMAPESDPSREFSTLYQLTVAPLRRYLTRLLGDGAEAQDVAHDAYLRVYPKVQAGTAQQPQALLYVTARNLALNRLKRRTISPETKSDVALEQATSRSVGVERTVMARQEWALVQKAIADLPPGCREVLLLRKVEMLSHQEISERMGIAISTIEKQHARALRLLKAALPPELFGPTFAARTTATEETP